MGRFQGIPVFPGYITRISDGHHKIIIYPPIFVDKTKDKAGDIRKAMIAISEVLEAHIRKYPEEWFWLHDRWKSVRNKDNP